MEHDHAHITGTAVCSTLLGSLGQHPTGPQRNDSALAEGVGQVEEITLVSQELEDTVAHKVINADDLNIAEVSLTVQKQQTFQVQMKRQSNLPSIQLQPPKENVSIKPAVQPPNGSLHVGSLPNFLPSPSIANTTVEQPNSGPCVCFICGCSLTDPSERFSYLKVQKLFSMQLTLLELLSEIINQNVVTNTDSVELCSRCSELINETDNAYKHLHKLKKQVTGLFNNNQRPKLTFHVLPKSTNLNAISSYVGAQPYHQQPTLINLDDLAASRPRRGRARIRKTDKDVEKTTERDLLNRPNPVKKKGGRPRKPFPCSVCRRKFLTQEVMDSHLAKEHDIHPPNEKAPVCNLPPSSDAQDTSFLSTFSQVKQEQMNLDEVKEEKEDIREKSPAVTTKTSTHMGMELLPSSLISRPILTASKAKPSPSKVGSESASQLLATMRPIKPKPQTVVQTKSDGSMVFFMSPTSVDSAPAMIRVTAGYMNMNSDGFTCSQCKKTFLDEKSHRMHRIAAHSMRKRKREREDTLVIDEEDYKTEDCKKLWDCDQCEASFQNKLLLGEHKQAAHLRLGAVPRDSRREKLYSCDHCHLIFNYKYELERHRETHMPFNQTGPHEFVCSLCGLKVASKAALKIHLHRFHSTEEEPKDFLCSECGYMAATKKAFSVHQRTHSDSPGPKRKCPACEKEMLASSFKIHMIRMHGEARHACETCGQRFTIRSDLMRHINTVHSSIRPYDCDVCGDKFITSDALRYHRNKAHSTMVHRCEFCDKCYKWKGELRTHIYRSHSVHKPRYLCSLCSRHYADRRKLRHHMAVKHSSSQEIAYFTTTRQEQAVQKISSDVIFYGP